MEPKKHDRSVMTRRDALRLLMGASALLGSQTVARAETEEELRAQADATQQQVDEAKAEYDAVKAQLDGLAAEIQELSVAQAQTLDQIYTVEEEIRHLKEEIEETEGQITEKEAELEEKQERLSRRIASAYKSGGRDFLSILLSASSFEELESNMYYLDKISEADENLIKEVKQIKQDLEDQKATLEQNKSDLEADLAELEELNAQQQSQMEDLQAKRDEVSGILADLDQKVRDLVAQHDAELLAAEQEAARARAYTGGARVDPSELIQGASGSQAAVISACYSTPSPGGGLCAWWVEDVFANAGVCDLGGNACDLYNWWCYSSDRDEIQPGMIVAVSTYPTWSSGSIYGHVGIYIGGGMVMENIGFINTRDLDGWIADYSGSVTPRWGWMGGIALA